ncbi:hypothetical protein ACWY4P_15685 [Streptomyces sp. LZ34]
MSTLDDRMARYPRERLDGYSVPEDLRVLLTAHGEGRNEIAELFGITLL